MKRPRLAWTVVALLVAACTSPSPTPSPTTATDQVLRLRYQETGSLDPNDFFFDGTVRLLTSTLIGLDEGLNTVPGIAEVWEATDEGQHVTFQLRDARYSNGEPIVAADFVYSWRRLLDPRRPGADEDLGYLFADVVGAADLLAITSDALPPEDIIDGLLAGLGISAPDPRTLEVDLSRPASWFPALVSNPATAPVPEAWITRPGATEGGAYVSSGPYVLTEWVHDEQRTLEPNPMWWGNPPELDRIEMRTFPSDSEAVDAFRRGELDIVYLAEGIGQAPDLESQARPLPGGNIWYVPFDRVKAGSPTAVSAELRRALSLAVDREGLSAVLQPDGPIAGSLIPPGMPGHDPSLVSVFDPEAARRSLERALQELGLSSADQIHVSMGVSDFAQTWPASAAYMAQQWRDQLGIQVELVSLELEAWVEQIGQHIYDLEWNGWIPDYPHPQNYLEPTFACMPGNLYGYCNPAYDDLLDRAARTEDPEQQLALYQDAQRLIVEDPVGIFVAWPGGQALVAPWVEGLVLTPMDEADFPGVLFLHQVTVAPHD